MSWPRAFGPGNPVDLQRFGPTLKVILSNPNRNELEPSVEPHVGEAVVDTGATGICVDESIVKKLDLQFIAPINMIAVGKSHAASRYLAMVEVPELSFKKIMPVSSPDGGSVSPSILLGRSFLRHYIFTFNGITGACHIHNDARESGAGAGPGSMYEENDG